MGGCRCSYKTCTSNTTPGKVIHFFHYPVKSPEVCSQWIKNAEKPLFSLLAEDQLKNKVVCEYHFEDRLFTNSQKKRLLKGAIPTLDGCAIQPKLHTQIQAKDDANSKINLLSANEDATLFVLETSGINFQNTQSAEKVESYIYQNGSLVPINPSGSSGTPNKEATDVSSSKIDLSASEHVIFQDIDTENKNDLQSFLFVDVENSNQQNYSIFYNENSQESVDIKPVTSNQQTPQIKSTIPLRKRILSTNIQDSVHPEKRKVVQQKLNGIEIEYIRKINEHSKEIANIKKFLQNFTSLQRPVLNKYSVLSTAKRLLPPTLVSVLRMHLTRRPTPEDMTFFISIYEKSPEVYSMLSRDCSWNFPDVELVKNFTKKQKH